MEELRENEQLREEVEKAIGSKSSKFWIGASKDKYIMNKNVRFSEIHLKDLDLPFLYINNVNNV